MDGVGVEDACVLFEDLSVNGIVSPLVPRLSPPPAANAPAT